MCVNVEKPKAAYKVRLTSLKMRRKVAVDTNEGHLGALSIRRESARGPFSKFKSSTNYTELILYNIIVFRRLRVHFVLVVGLFI
jgi:hypothetical protein